MTNAKIYARQVRPEWQESDIFEDDYYEDIIVRGNDSCKNADLLNAIDAISEDIQDFIYEEFDGDTLSDNDYAKIAEWLSENYTYGTENHKIWTVEETKEFIHASKEYEDFFDKAYLLSIYTGDDWEYCMIYGCCQGDFERIFYPSGKYTKKDIETFEVGYFNLGSEWIVHDDETIPERPEDIHGYSVYCYTSDPREEIAENFGVKPEDVVMYECEMKYMPVYRLCVI